MAKIGLDKVENADCGRIRKFLEALAKDDAALKAYINDPSGYLTAHRAKYGLQEGDVLLLLSNDYDRVQELMKQCNSAVRWIVIWIV